MARSINDIKTDLMAKVAADATLSGLLTSSSAVAVYTLCLYIFSVAAFTLESLWDIFKVQVDDTIAHDKPHRPQWYVDMAKEFQYGFALVPEKDYYDNTGIADSVVAASKIVKYAAIVEEPFVRMKVAKQNGLQLQKLSAPDLPAFTDYVKRYKDAGVKLHGTTIYKPATITSTDPDKLKLTLRIKYDALVLNGNGERIDGTSLTPVPDGIRGYISSLDFNGVFSLQKLVDAIQKVEGVKDLRVDACQTKYAALPFTTVDIDFVPDSGYLIIENADLTITYIPS